MGTLLEGKHVFIVEDDLGNRIIAQLLLEENGAKTAFERWGRHTVERLLAFMPVDIILLDLMFPNNVTGYDIFDQIRLVPDLVTIPIVAVSASDPSTTIPKVREKGFAGFISKPLDFHQFAPQVAAILRGEPVWHSR